MVFRCRSIRREPYGDHLQVSGCAAHAAKRTTSRKLFFMVVTSQVPPKSVLPATASMPTESEMRGSKSLRKSLKNRPGSREVERDEEWISVLPKSVAMLDFASRAGVT